MTVDISPARIEALLKDVTPGKWQLDGIVIESENGDGVCLMGEPAQYPGDVATMLPNHEANAAFIAAAREIVPAQAARIAKLEAALVLCRDEIDGHIRAEYPSDHPYHERKRQADFAANPARAALKGSAE